ncbi:MAG: hypothetical protein ACRECT_06025 [Thermoplasmata archaeon]
MLAFDVEMEVKAPPQFVVDWWWDFSSDDAAITPGMIRREVEHLTDRTVQLTTYSEMGGRERKTVGIVTRTGPFSWQLLANVTSGVNVASTLRTSYSVAPDPAGSVVRARFEFQGRTVMWRFLLSLARRSIREDRVRSFASYVTAIEADYSRSKTPGAAAPVGPPLPSGPR